MKIIHERETQKKSKNRKEQGEGGEDRSCSERVRAKSELVFSIILKQSELYESKYVAMECRCLKI